MRTIEYTEKYKSDDFRYDELVHELVGELDKRQWETFGGHVCDEWFRFSMCKYEEDGSYDYQLYPDLNDNTPLIEGDVTVRIEDWDNKESKMTSPTLLDVVKFFANNHDGHHGYLEDIEYKNGQLVVISGS